MYTHRKILTLTRQPPRPQTPSHARTRPRPLPHSLLSARPSLCDSARGLLPSPSSAATASPPSPSSSTRRARPLSFTPGSGQIHGGRAPRRLDPAPPPPRRRPSRSRCLLCPSSPLLSSLCPQSHSHRTDRRPPRPDDYDEEELGDESVQATGSKTRRPIHPPASDPIRSDDMVRCSVLPLPSPPLPADPGAILTSWWMCLARYASCACCRSS